MDFELNDTVVIVTISVPMTTSAQFDARERSTSDAEGRRGRARNSPVSSSERRSRKRNGMMAQPTSSGTRHPQLVIDCGVSVAFRMTPISAANITAICWLADCQLT